jgi:hypothetical protein
MIFDGLTLDGEDTSDYGIKLDRQDPDITQNNTINNIKSHNHQKDGILL